MSTTISPLRRITVTLALTGAAAFSAIAIAPSAFAADSVAPVTSVTTPAATDPAAVPALAPAAAPAPVAAPAVDPAAGNNNGNGNNGNGNGEAPKPDVLDKNGKPVKAPKICSDKDLADSLKKVADATKKAAPLFALATASHKAAVQVRALEIKLTTPQQLAAAEALANGLDMVGDKLSAQAQASITNAGILDCFIVSTPGGRF